MVARIFVVPLPSTSKMKCNMFTGGSQDETALASRSSTTGNVEGAFVTRFEGLQIQARSLYPYLVSDLFHMGAMLASAPAGASISRRTRTGAIRGIATIGCQ